MTDELNRQDVYRLRVDVEAKHTHHTVLKTGFARPDEEFSHELQKQEAELDFRDVKSLPSPAGGEESGNGYTDIYKFVPVAYVTLADRGVIVDANSTSGMLLRVEQKRLLNKRFEHYVVPKERAHWRRLFEGTVTHGDRQRFETVLQRGDGSAFNAHLDCLRVQPGGAGPMVRIAFTGIFDHKKVEDMLKQRKLVIDTAMDGFWIADEMGNLQEANEAYAKMSGYSIDELINMHISQLEAKEKSREEVDAHISKIIAQGYERFETRHRHKDGHEIEVEVSATYMPESRRFFVFCHDITERKAAEEEIRNLAFYDTLTQLPNRRMLSDRLSQAMASSKRSGRYGALMFIDLDNFKPLNDAYGHNVGDVLLQQVARRITSCMREMDTVARFGGDEFVVMLSDLDVDEAESIAQSRAVAEKVRAILAEPYSLVIRQDDKAATMVEHHCTSSIGIVLFINHQASQDDVIKWADMAMYQAKGEGGDLIRFFSLKA